ncbi:SRPBCC family protein [Arthrobacter sp. UYEF3]|uniref:SRPBCC family protein n=1 Tax=Arthrobacter sp. UYEF3 TaxID=1756365 RepID=UPI0033980F88
MECGSIERVVHIEATPEVVYEVSSTPEHLREWWPDEAECEPVPGRPWSSRLAIGLRRRQRS